MERTPFRFSMAFQDCQVVAGGKKIQTVDAEFLMCFRKTDRDEDSEGLAALNGSFFSVRRKQAAAANNGMDYYWQLLQQIDSSSIGIGGPSGRAK